MYKLFLSLILLLATVFINSNACLAGAPIINNVSGSVNHKGILTLSGANFGNKSKAAPTRHDDFKGGTVGDRLDSETNGGWYTYSYGNKSLPYYDNAVVRYPNTLSANQSGGSAYIGLRGFGSTQKMYVSGWFNLETGGAPSRNVKLINMEANDAWQTRIDSYPHTGGSGHMYTTVHCDGSTTGAIQTYATSYQKTAVPDNQWHRIETYVNQGTAAGGGYRDVWVDGVKIGQITGTFVDGTCGIDQVLLGHYFSTTAITSSNPKSGTACGSYAEGAVVQYKGDGKYYTCLSTGKFNVTGASSHPDVPWSKRFWDEIYVDTTQARIEIGDAPIWDDCIHKEIQTPSAWSSTSITARVNLGSFQAGKQLYLYVVDAEGNVNSKGFPIDPTLENNPPLENNPTLISPTITSITDINN